MERTRVLIVDDEAVLRDVLARILQHAGYATATATSVPEALAAATAQRPDLVISDVRMPGGTGLDLCAALPAALGYAPPVMLCSGLGAENDILAGFDAGAVDYLVKPWREEELLAKVRLHTRQRRSADTPKPVTRTLAAGRLRLGAQLGVGGMGSVFRADDVRLGRSVAVKILRPDLVSDESFVVRFLHEARVLSRLDVAGVPRVHDVGREGDSYYYVMDIVPGETLRRRVTREGRLGARELVAVGLGVARILEGLAAADIRHRDIKPDNVLVAPDGRIGLVDFGLARSPEEPRLTREDSVVGTAGYLPPEALLGTSEPDERGDLYGLAMTLWFAASGKDPSRDTSDVGRLLATMSRGAIDLRDAIPDAPEGLVRLLARMSEPRPERRPHSAGEVRRAFESLEKELVGESLDTVGEHV